MHSSTIHVILPVRNGAPYLRAALDSLAAQTHRDFRLVACDDGSSDDTWSVLTGETRFPVECFRNTSLPGLVSTSNQVLERALGAGARYIARIDADDISHPQRLALQKAFLDRHAEVGVLGSAIRLIDGKDAEGARIDYPLEDEDIRFTLLFEDCLPHPALMFRASAFSDPAYRYNSRYEIAEDYDLWTRMAGRVRFANLPDELLRYRRHANSVSITRSRLEAESTRSIRLGYLDRLDFSEREIQACRQILGLDTASIDLERRLKAMISAQAALSRAFPKATRRGAGAQRMSNLTASLWALLTWPQRLRWMRENPSMAGFYLGAKFGLSRPPACP